MKRYCLYALLLLLILLLSSCGARNETAFFDTFYPVKCDNVLCKLNVLDGTLTPLCNDPLCDHTYDSGCPLCGYDMGCVWNGTLYFTARSSAAVSKPDELRAYDFDTSAVKLVCRLPEIPASGGGTLGFRGGYFCQDYTASDEDFSIHYSVCLEDGKIEEYEGNTRDFMQTQTPRAFYKKKPLLVKMKEDALHGTISLGDQVLYDGELAITFADQITDGKLLYGIYHRDENGRVNVDEMSLYMLDLDSGESRLFSEDFNDVYFALIDGWIYYVRYIDDPPVIGYDKNNQRDAVNGTGGIIWRMNLETGAEEEFLSLPEYHLWGYEISAFGDRFLIRYSNTDYSVWEEIPDSYHGDVWYEYPKTNGWIIVNPADRTWFDAPAVLDGKMSKNVSRIQ